MDLRSRMGTRRLPGRRPLGGLALLAATGLVAAACGTYTAASSPTSLPVPRSAAAGLGQLTGQLPRDKLTEESALAVDLDKETVRLPLYPGDVHGQRVWYFLLDASDAGAAHDLGVNYAPKLANLPIGDPAAMHTVTLDHPTPVANPFGPAGVHFAGAPDFSPTRVARPHPDGFPLVTFRPGAVAGPGYSPFIRIDGSPTVYNAPIVATGDGPFDVAHHGNTADRVLGVHIAGPSAPGQFAQSWVDMLFVKGFDAGQPIVYLSTDAGQPLTAVLERSTYVPALDSASFTGATTSSAPPASACSASSTAGPAPATRRLRASGTSCWTGTPPRTPPPATPR